MLLAVAPVAEPLQAVVRMTALAPVLALVLTPVWEPAEVGGQVSG